MENEMPNVYFQSTKTYTHSIGLSCCFRQWRANSHCNLLHGYAIEVKLTFEASELDERNWVQDFGGLKDVKSWLEGTFDHSVIVAEDDPKKDIFHMLHQQQMMRVVVLPNVGCEAFAKTIFEHIEKNVRLSSPHAYLKEVEVREHAGNSAKCIRA